ncbi:hypothetical protein AVEN_212551-1 [Araneus ventricosus]|uniref:Uncharacterized protein n=1 Tax=Araneus ventricosus TaxID=182803 RepID=A0A4Y2PAN8_ARAVE|nr:hypothetical protein AVEN_212551-1 [Araneus ventricosus]
MSIWLWTSSTLNTYLKYSKGFFVDNMSDLLLHLSFCVRLLKLFLMQLRCCSILNLYSMKSVLSRPFTSQINWIFWNARRKQPSKSMEISRMACGGSNSAWIEIGAKPLAFKVSLQRDPERG